MTVKSLLLRSVAIICCIGMTAPSVVVAEATKIDERARRNQFWWPDLLDLSALRDNDPRSNPLGEDFNYAEAFNVLDYEQLKRDLNELLVTSQDWWLADFGNYGPFFIRMAWHSAGTYRLMDDCGSADGGQQRFEPLNSWPDNANLDKARRLLWPIKKKYGQAISWSDLIILAGTIGMENMGFPIYGFAAGREGDWEPELVYWGPESVFLGAERQTAPGDFQRDLGATQMGLIYVNPEGPQGNPDPMESAKMIREAFGRMAMDDEETVALIAGGHSFVKAHGAMKNDKCIGPEPAAAPVEKQGLGWINSCGKGDAEDTFTSGLERAWTATPAAWNTMYLDNLFAYDWEMTKSPAGATQWTPKGDQAEGRVPDAHLEGVTHKPIMFTTDLSLKTDPAYSKIAQRFRDDPDAFQNAFARAWFKLTHRDMGPVARYLGPDVPKEALLWQDPVPTPDYTLISNSDIADIKQKITDSDISRADLVRTAWASAASFRESDMRGGANGARLRLDPQKGWAVNDPDQLASVLEKLEAIRSDVNSQLTDGKQISMADLIVLGGATAIEAAAIDAGVTVTVPFRPGRGDATQEMTDVDGFNYLELKADGFRNYYDDSALQSPTEMLVDRADQLDLSVPEMTVLIGGMRALGANAGGSEAGVFTDKPGTLSTDFFVNLLDMSTDWQRSSAQEGLYEGHDRKSGDVKWTATSVDLIFGQILSSEPWQRSMPLTGANRNSSTISSQLGPRS